MSDVRLSELLESHIAKWPGSASAWACSAGSGVEAWAGELDRSFAWASVSKLLVALSCLVAAEEGTVSLASQAGPEGSTLAHLLAHASGLPPEGRVPLAPPGRRRVYSNSGMEVAAAHLASRAGMSFEEYLRAGVLEPLGMRSTLLEGSPAHGATGPIVDLALLAREMAGICPILVSAPARQQAVSVAWPGLVGVLPGFGRQDPCDWGLGPEIRGHKSPHWTGLANSPATYGHFGQSGSFVWVDPVAGVALAGLCSTPFGPWAKDAWPVLADDVLSVLAA